MSSTHQRPALDMIAELRRGKTAHDLTQKIHDLVAACVDTGKKGDIVLKLTFEPDADDDTRMKVTDQIAVKAPTRNQKPSLFFLTDDLSLTRTDPSQHTIPGTSDDAAQDEEIDEPDAGSVSPINRKAR
ncbi:hypothetical protein [Nocardioides sp. LHG3406-4]|uniref:hypothetical protein n=1 Tax=Nocardioides sp. LHG3406-4 TaxID=2804575 RepID=UPI003CF95F6B